MTDIPATSTEPSLGRRLLDLQWSYEHADEHRQWGEDDAAIERRRELIAAEYEAVFRELVRDEQMQH